MFCFVCLVFFCFNIKVTFYLVLQTQYNPGFTEEGCGQMSDEDNIFDPRKIKFIIFYGVIVCRCDPLDRLGFKSLKHPPCPLSFLLGSVLA